MIPFILFPSYLGSLMLIRGSKNLEHLTHVAGTITNVRIIKHERKSKFKVYYESVLVLAIEGTSDEFGITDRSKDYLLSFLRKGSVADVYYDQSGKRIEQNITLHVFDLTVDTNKIINIIDVQKEEKIGAIICFTLAILFLLLTFLGLRIIEKRGII